MRFRRAVLGMLVGAALVLPGAATGANPLVPKPDPYSGSKWIRLWESYDSSVWRAMKPAAATFKVSTGTLSSIVLGEGGNVSPRKLERSLCSGAPGEIGWNLSGSAAFGPAQFMLDYRGACWNPRAWGTFGAYDDAAFRAARQKGLNVPYRYKHPASNVGQMITTAYMLSIGGLSHWCASQC